MRVYAGERRETQRNCNAIAKVWCADEAAETLARVEGLNGLGADVCGDPNMKVRDAQKLTFHTVGSDFDELIFTEPGKASWGGDNRIR